jgi:LysR family glycine cleavage system transcriptional activator
MTLPPFSALRAFEAAARLGSFRAAAAELRLSESAVSHQVKNLETWLGRRVFERRRQGLELTGEGAAYARDLTEAIGLMRAATERLAAIRQGTVTVSAAAAVTQHWLLPRLTAFQDEHPGIEVRLHSSTRQVDFAREAIDLGIRYLAAPPAALRAERLFRERPIPVASPALLARYGTVAKPAELLAMPRLHNGLHPGEWYRWAVQHGVVEGETPGAGTDVEAGMVLDSADAVLRGAAAGLGVGLGRQPMVLDALRDGSVVRACAASLDENRSYWLVAPPEALRRPAVRAFHDWLLKAVRESVSQEAPDGEG